MHNTLLHNKELSGSNVINSEVENVWFKKNLYFLKVWRSYWEQTGWFWNLWAELIWRITLSLRMNGPGPGIQVHLFFFLQTNFRKPEPPAQYPLTPCTLHIWWHCHGPLLSCTLTPYTSISRQAAVLPALTSLPSSEELPILFSALSATLGVGLHTL